MFGREMLRKGYDFSIINFRDMGAFQNCTDTHVNIGFYQSEPPGTLANHEFLQDYTVHCLEANIQQCVKYIKYNNDGEGSNMKRNNTIVIGFVH